MVKEGKLNVSTISLSDLECVAHSNDVPKLILVPLIGIESKGSISSVVLQYFLLLFQAVFKKLQDVSYDVSCGICFWTWNVEIPKPVCGGRARGGTQAP